MAPFISHRSSFWIIFLMLIPARCPLLAASDHVYKDPGQPLEIRVADLLARMTVEEKIGQLQSQFINDKTKLDARKLRRDPNVGFIVNYARANPGDAEGIAEQNNAEMKQTVEGHRLGIPVLIHAEGHHGVTTVPSTKHFVANYGDGGRDSAPVYFSERELREYWLAPFEAAIVEGGSLGVMPAYNSVNGLPMHGNGFLLNDILRGEWAGFHGVVGSLA